MTKRPSTEKSLPDNQSALHTHPTASLSIHLGARVQRWVLSIFEQSSGSPSPPPDTPTSSLPVMNEGTRCLRGSLRQMAVKAGMLGKSLDAWEWEDVWECLLVSLSPSSSCAFG